MEALTKPVETDEIAQGQFSTREAKIVLKARKMQERKLTFQKLCCAKEAALKSIGEGLPFGMNAFEFSPRPTFQVTKVPPSCMPDGIEAWNF